MKNSIHLFLTFCYLLIFSLTAVEPAAAASGVGKVVFAMGQPSATDISGINRGLLRGDPVYSGDTLATGNGRIQISFIDGAFISLQPDTEYQIDQFRYNGKQDGTERAIFRLLKGGIRALTGLIGKNNRDAYKVHTPIATIGIRGTGYNTRICQGDCPGHSDGLYHNTWEGETYVTNDVDRISVPSGRGIFIGGIRDQILTLPPGGVTGLRIPETDDEVLLGIVESEIDDVLAFLAGEQLDTGGTPQIIAEALALALQPPPLSNVKSLGIMVVAAPDAAGQPDQVDGFLAFNVTGFFDITTNKPIGFLFTTTDPANVNLFNLVSVDLDAVLLGDDPAAVTAANNLVTLVDQATIDLFKLNPAVVAEFAQFGQIAWARWTGGRIFTVDSSGLFDVTAKTGFQSAHFIYGPPPPLLPVTGTAFFTFAGGTQSTSVSGATIGSGVIAGNIGVDFGQSSAFINMDILHNGISYSVWRGNLLFDGSGKLTSALPGGNGVTALSRDPSSLCGNGCPVIVLGSFFGNATDPALPGYIGLKYNIQETDPIMGVAAFNNAPAPAPLSTAKPLGTMVVAAPDLAGQPDQVNGFLAFNVTGFFDVTTNKPIGFLFTTTDAANVTLNNLVSVDLDAVLGGNDPTAVTSANNLVTLVDPVAIDLFRQNPATVAEFVQFGQIAWARWTGGRIFTVDSSGAFDVTAMTGSQSVHMIYGPPPPLLPVTGGASFLFVGGSQSTSVSGATIGAGVLSGDIFVDFGLSSAGINMDILHAGIPYTVRSGSLILDSAGSLTSTGGVVSAFATDPGSICGKGCTTIILGDFFGSAAISPTFPGYIGLKYNIQETDPIMGVAAFEFTTGF